MNKVFLIVKKWSVEIIISFFMVGMLIFTVFNKKANNSNKTDYNNSTSDRTYTSQNSKNNNTNYGPASNIKKLVIDPKEFIDNLPNQNNNNVSTKQKNVKTKSDNFDYHSKFSNYKNKYSNKYLSASEYDVVFKYLEKKRKEEISFQKNNNQGNDTKELLKKHFNIDYDNYGNINNYSNYNYGLGNDVYVNPYIKDNGTKVDGYFRTKPDGDKSNNYSTKGNINPYTGKKGTK